jgi:decaprenylphospho-beta-D-ribofuranose 2-oxidase
LVSAAAGTSLHELIITLLAQQLFVPVTPGTRYVTLGGAVAADIHGKNHHRDGSFGDQVLELDLVTPDGQQRTVGPHADPDLFWATVGGMGLAGVITRVTFRALPVESAYVTVRTERIAGLEALVRTMREHDDEFRYSVAWIDTVARGRALGRSVLTRGDHSTASELTGAATRNPWRSPGDPRLAVPVIPPVGLVNRPGVRAFNELWFRKAPRDRVDLQSIPSFFHPLDLVKGWNRLYGRSGLVQYQLVVPDTADAALADALRLLSDAGEPSFLAVLKRFGAGNPGVLSFPVPGWTLALDLPAGPALAPLFRTLDDLVVEAGGRLYLAKDSRLSPETFDRMYERADEFRKLRRGLDPDGVLQSDLARRLHL